MAMMEGTLWKWTNYLSGWQPRWFVLEVGVLAYYKSQEEVGLGSRGSIKMACCEISVIPTDAVRIELKIPPDQHIYLRAATAAERQQWLVALGTAKACITQAHNAAQEGTDGHSIEHLKVKMEELSMYQGLLLQEINTIKLLCTNKEDTQEFNEAATMLSATCDEFLKNMCDCIEIAKNNFGAMSTPSTPTSPTPTSINKSLSVAKHAAFRKHLLHEGHRSTSPPPSPSSSIASTLSSSLNGQSTGPSDRQSVQSSAQVPRQQPIHTRANTSQPLSNTADQSARHGRPAGAAELLLNSTEHKRPASLASSRHSLDSHSSQSEDLKELQTWTFFSSSKYKFEEIQITSDGGVPTKSFLAACGAVLPFFDVLGSTAFAPVKMDISGNIKKISGKYETDDKAFVTLQNIVYQELKSNTCTTKNSATDALLWLKRALEFMQVFLAEVLKGERDLAVAAGTAYGKSLRRYHGWVVRGVFSLAVKAVPYREDFLTSLGTTSKGVATHKDVLTDMKTCVNGLGRVTSLLNQFYRKHKLDSDSAV